MSKSKVVDADGVSDVPYVRAWHERVRTTWRTLLPSKTDPSFAVDQSAEDIVRRFTRIGEAGLSRLGKAEGGFVDVTGFQDKTAAELYISSRDKIGAAALRRHAEQQLVMREGVEAVKAKRAASKAAAAASAAGSPGAAAPGTSSGATAPGAFPGAASPGVS